MTARPLGRPHWAGIATLLPAILMAACSTTAMATQRAAQPPLPRYETYAIQPGAIVTDHAPTPMPDQLVQGRIDSALHEELGAKGLEPVSDKEAELIVTYSASTANRQAVVVDPSAPYASAFVGGARGGPDVWIQDYRLTKLTIDMVDAGTGQVVWRSETNAMNKNLRSPKFIAQTVGKALAKFPAGGELRNTH